MEFVLLLGCPAAPGAGGRPLVPAAYIAVPMSSQSATTPLFHAPIMPSARARRLLGYVLVWLL
jgi:hypothetical protein